MNNLLAMLAAMALAQQQANGDKPIDYDHPLVEGEPIVPCCDKMGRLDVTSNPCICADKRHQGAIVHSLNCDCPDRFIPMKDMSRPPKIEVVGRLAIEVNPQASGERLKRLGLDSMN